MPSSIPRQWSKGIQFGPLSPSWSANTPSYCVRAQVLSYCPQFDRDTGDMSCPVSFKLGGRRGVLNHLNYLYYYDENGYPIYSFKLSNMLLHLLLTIIICSSFRKLEQSEIRIIGFESTATDRHKKALFYSLNCFILYSSWFLCFQFLIVFTTGFTRSLKQLQVYFVVETKLDAFSFPQVTEERLNASE